jgi:hypothetical protein
MATDVGLLSMSVDEALGLMTERHSSRLERRWNVARALRGQSEASQRARQTGLSGGASVDRTGRSRA